MESFAAVVRALLTRIRAFEASRPRPPLPTSTSDAEAPCNSSRYRVPPTQWGLEGAGEELATGSETRPDGATALSSAEPSNATPGRGKAHRSLSLTTYAMPVPRGLPTT